MPLTVAPVASRAERKAFLGFPYDLYRDEPRWVAPLRMAERVLQDPRKNPFFRHGTALHFLARREGRVVGRVAAIENRRHNEFHSDRVGFFGFFDVEPDPEAARALLEAARAWTAARGLGPLRGPVNYTTNDTCGVLVEGFESRPYVQMPWNRPDYDALVRAAGLVPAKDLVCYGVQSREPLPERLQRVAARALERGGFEMRTFRARDGKREIEILHDLYNRSWERNWGFVPMTDEEFAHAAKDLRQIVDPRVFLIVERGGVPVGFVGVVPDVNEALAGLDGRLFPFGIFRLMRRLKRIRRGRVMLLGVVPEARGRGVNAALFVEAVRRSSIAGYLEGEAGWILEDNEKMRADLEAAGCAVTRRLRIYETPAATPPPAASS